MLSSYENDFGDTKQKMKNLSKQILNITTPYSEEFSRGNYSVFLFDDNYDGDRYILGEHLVEGYGLFYSYNLTAVPVKVPYERVTKLLGISITEKNIKKKSDLIHRMLEDHHYWETVNSSLFEEIDQIQVKISDLLTELSKLNNI